MSHQSVIYAVWLGIAVLALIAANLYQWHTRRLLNQCRAEVSSLADRRVPTAAPVDSSIFRVSRRESGGTAGQNRPSRSSQLGRLLNPAFDIARWVRRRSLVANVQQR